MAWLMLAYVHNLFSSFLDDVSKSRGLEDRNEGRAGFSTSSCWLLQPPDKATIVLNQVPVGLA